MRAAYDLATECRARFDTLAAPYDAVVTPSTTGEAPLGQESTGTATFNRIWTLLHAPCVNVPGFICPGGMPVVPGGGVAMRTLSMMMPFSSG